jgi:hypothetical protein
MKDYKKLNLPLLTEQDEEYHILKEVAEEYTRQHEKTAEKKSGNATENVIRNHLLSHGFNVSLNPELKIHGSNKTADRIDSLLLKPNVDPTRYNRVYSPNEVSVVIEIKNNGVADQSSKIAKKFNQIMEISDNFRFAVIVLSEKLLSQTPYPYAICEEDIGIENCRVFTSIIRREWDKTYDKTVVVKMLRDGRLWNSHEWQGFIDYLTKYRS